MPDLSADLPSRIQSVEQLEELLSWPTEAAVAAMGRLEGDVIVLGAAGKMGPTLARMVRRASDETGRQRKVWAVSRFSDAAVRARLEQWGIETVAGDLLDAGFLASLPDAANVIYMAGMKFGATGNEALTWAINVMLPADVCRRYADSRIAAFSTGNVYPLVPVDRGGSRETDPPAPVGEYAMSCLGRERMFEHFSRAGGIPVAILRLNYAQELRYGVLVDLGRRVEAGEPIDLAMGYANVIWQADASAAALAALADADSPPRVLNIAGRERLSVRRVCAKFGELLQRPVRLQGEEAPDALLSDGSLARARYGDQRVGADQLIEWIADWIRHDQPLLGKPTHFDQRDGRF